MPKTWQHSKNFKKENYKKKTLMGDNGLKKNFVAVFNTNNYDKFIIRVRCLIGTKYFSSYCSN